MSSLFSKPKMPEIEPPAPMPDEQQIEATELTGYYFPEKITADYLNHLKNKTFRLGKNDTTLLH